jgi:hypothetical protein
LTVILLEVERLRDESAPRESRAESVARIRSIAEQAISLTRRLLDPGAAGDASSEAPGGGVRGGFPGRSR